MNLKKLAAIILFMSFIPTAILYLNKVKLQLFQYPNTDELSLYDSSFADIKKNMPGRGMIGYMADPDRYFALKKYYQTQYVLAPLILARDTSRDLIVCNFSDRNKFYEFVRKNNLAILNDLKNQVALVKKNNR